MDNEAFLDGVGTHCSATFCHQLDCALTPTPLSLSYAPLTSCSVLPFKCSSCSLPFCQLHWREVEHSCPEYDPIKSDVCMLFLSSSLSLSHSLRPLIPHSYSIISRTASPPAPYAPNQFPSPQERIPTSQWNDTSPTARARRSTPLESCTLAETGGACECAKRGRARLRWSSRFGAGIVGGSFVRCIGGGGIMLVPLLLRRLVEWEEGEWSARGKARVGSLLL